MMFDAARLDAKPAHVLHHDILELYGILLLYEGVAMKEGHVHVLLLS